MITLPMDYSQYDTRWCTHLLGFNSAPQYTIYNYGCLLCCIASVCKYYGITTDPLTLNAALCNPQDPGFAANSGEYLWGKLKDYFPTLSDSLVQTPDLLTDVQMGDIKNKIDSGIPVLLWIDYNPKTVQNDMHWVVAIAYNQADENDITIADPLGGIIHSLKDYLGWFKPSARSTIQGYGVITGPVPQVGQSNTVPVNTDVFPNLVHGDTQWEKTIAKYMVGTDPNQAMAEDLQKVIGGIQSLTTAAQNQLTMQKGDLAAAQQQVKNVSEELANEEAQRQADQTLYTTQLDALKASGSHVTQISQSYESRIKGLQEQIKSLLQDKSSLAVQNARLMAGNQSDFFTTYFPTFLSWLKKLKIIK